MNEAKINSHNEIDHAGTPNDVRHFPGHRSSSSIPIAPVERSPSEVQQDEEEAMAEYRDYMMYQRIVGSKSSDKTMDDHHHKSALAPPMPSESLSHLLQQASTMRLVAHQVTYGRDGMYAMPQPSWVQSYPRELAEFVQFATEQDEDEREEGVFELEL